MQTLDTPAPGAGRADLPAPGRGGTEHRGGIYHTGMGAVVQAIAVKPG